jgi:hypothetical protein
VICSICSDTTRVGKNVNLCGDDTACRTDKKKIKGPLIAAITMPIIALFVILVLLLHRTLKKKGNTIRRK